MTDTVGKIIYNTFMSSKVLSCVNFRPIGAGTIKKKKILSSFHCVTSSALTQKTQFPICEGKLQLLV